MKPSSLVGHLIELTKSFLRNPKVPADHVVRQFFFHRKYLGSTDRRFIADSFFYIVKNFNRLDALAQDAFESDKYPIELLVAGALVLHREMKPSEISSILKELPDTFSRNFSHETLSALADREREEARLKNMSNVKRLATLHSFPDWFVRRIKEEYGDEQLEVRLKAMNEEAPTVLRVNTLLMKSREELIDLLQKEGIRAEPSPVSKDAVILRKRANVTALQAFRDGLFEIQDESSQLVAPLGKTEKPTSKILDACAGAGGKTLHLAAILENRGEIYATDVEGRKLEELKKRVRRSGAQNVRIIKPEQQKQLLGKQKEGWFDLVLLDVPCTGTGTLRRNPGIKWALTEQMLEELVNKQRDIVRENLRYVKPGGRLLYATCSILKEEGEDQLAWLEFEFPGQFEVEETLRTNPEEGQDAFFAARLRKK